MNAAFCAFRRADNGQVQVPGGVIEMGETPYDAAVRETAEETGVHVGGIVLTGVYTDVRRGIISHVFRTAYALGTPTLSPESVWSGFLPLDEALGAMPAIFRPRVTDALAGGTRAVVFRSHDADALCRLDAGEDYTGQRGVIAVADS